MSRPRPGSAPAWRTGSGGQALWLDNGRVSCEVRLEKGRLAGDRLAAATGPDGKPGAALETDADFCLEVVWTDWRAPGKIDNADNPVRLGKDFFRFDRHETAAGEGGAQDLVLHFKGRDIPLELRLTYRLAPGDFFVRRRLEVLDPGGPRHFLQRIWTDGRHAGRPRPKSSRPADSASRRPGSCRPRPGRSPGWSGRRRTTGIRAGRDGRALLSCGQEIGERIGPAGIAGDWAVLAVTPDARVKHWFFDYLDRVRVAPLRPYMLYNSWYDLRSPELSKEPGTVMNEANVLRIVDLFRKNMTEKYGLKPGRLRAGRRLGRLPQRLGAAPGRVPPRAAARRRRAAADRHGAGHLVRPHRRLLQAALAPGVHEGPRLRD